MSRRMVKTGSVHVAAKFPQAASVKTNGACAMRGSKFGERSKFAVATFLAVCVMLLWSSASSVAAE